MALNKKMRMVFENLIQKGKIPMPREVIKIDQTFLCSMMKLRKVHIRRWYSRLHYIKLDENPNSDPMPKQSFQAVCSKRS